MTEINLGKCKEHQRNYEGFCKICNVVICPSCVMFGSHRKHDVLTLKQGAMFIRREIDNGMFKGLLKKETSETKILSIKENGLIIEKSKTEPNKEDR
jgi:late competence protein required for DNA uptake (superfamily II DNA/RNA helicase)